jgi:hypothetical protein
MKRASYREAVEWIARNDEAGSDDAFDVTETSFLVTTLLISDLFDVDNLKVGADVVRKRKQFQTNERNQP